MKTVSEIRRTYIDYFKKQGHEEVASSSLVPQNDPSLMFTNAGMVQFKDVFTGKEKRPYTRAVTSQKCVRAGGKHNDLENVGYTARHHTFFEMLGNFSFGDYFKDDAIAFAWELVTKDFGLDASKLLVTVHSTDEEAAGIWKKVTGFSDDRIIRIPTDDNFWSMGDTGPCGPCTEIFYDHGEDIPGGPPGSPDEDGDRFVEIWNNVFMQFEQLADGSRIDLPKPSVDTGMGLERISAILQGKHNNYDIDLLRDIIEHSADLTSSDVESASHKVIADHLRAAAFLIADGVLPSNEGRGYVLRRIMRRGMRHAHLLGAKDPLMYRLFPTLKTKMGAAYPELGRAETLISETLRIEEERFKKTLDRGLKLLADETSSLSKGDTLAGDTAFKLYDTYGFPVDLTADALREEGIQIDMNGFNAAMEKQKAAARAAWSGSGDAATDKLWFEIEEEHGISEFLGYAHETAEAHIIAIVKDGKLVKSLKKGDEAQIITNQTPFYGESGGQMGDMGSITTDDVAFDVADTQKQLGKIFTHIGKLEKGSLNVGDAVVMSIDGKRRRAIKANHSATHLLHQALRNHLGDHITQKGSLVAPDRLRFDISHPKAITHEELASVEREVNDHILDNTAVETKYMPMQDAIDSGAMALFGEKYDDEVRVLTMGTPDAETGKPYSVELCGGTHVTRTGDIGLIKIITESAVAAGVRRIEAVTAMGVYDRMKERDDVVGEISENLKVPVAEAAKRVSTLLDEKKKLEKEISDLKRKLATAGPANDAGADVKDINGVKFTARVLEDFPPKDLKPMADDLKKQIGSGVVALVAVNEGKASLVVGVTEDLTDKLNAVDLVKAGSEALGGQGGGGRPDMAQAGGPNGSSAQSAVTKIEEKIA